MLSVTKKQTGAKGHDKLLVSVSPPPVRDEDDSTMHIIQFASNYAIPAHSVPSAISVGGLSSPGSRNKPSPHFVPYGPRIPGDAYPSYRYKACASAYSVLKPPPISNWCPPPRLSTRPMTISPPDLDPSFDDLGPAISTVFGCLP
ncbi:hypothetical protein CNYM01_14294 [Colletotrichum nymphaeae SA-01]|uniref:Uncharacterized protein n=1 Tax=Colletotrichum nymphaeae SA-01 TaxID=1460502 RepID=A0A135UU11_9PEZI|nr:hypothetical protein CNYM01_14294 [Colletotrichum nymphaeae SA-01]